MGLLRPFLQHVLDAFGDEAFDPLSMLLEHLRVLPGDQLLQHLGVLGYPPVTWSASP
jgi:hypothetical protein